MVSGKRASKATHRDTMSAIPEGRTAELVKPHARCRSPRADRAALPGEKSGAALSVGE